MLYEKRIVCACIFGYNKCVNISMITQELNRDVREIAEKRLLTCGVRQKNEFPQAADCRIRGTEMVGNEELCEIFFETWKVPVGIFSEEGELLKLYANAGKRLTEFYLRGADHILRQEKSREYAVLRFDQDGSCWGVLPLEEHTVLYGPVQTGRNMSFLYDEIPEYSWGETGRIFRSLALSLRGKDTRIVEKRREAGLTRAAGQMYRTHRGKNELDSMDDVFECVRQGDTQGLLRTLERKKYRSYIRSIMQDEKESRTVFLFNLAKSYHTALSECPVIGDLVPLVEQYLSEIPKYRSIAAFQSGMGRMLYDFTRYVEQYRDEKYSAVINKALKYIKENIYAEITVKEIAAHCALSVSALQHRFKKETGLSVSEFILKSKTERACYFLQYTEIPCGDIAFRMGFCTQSYFTRQFRKQTGMTPLEYRAGRRT